MAKKRSCSHENYISAYVDPYIYKVVVADNKVNGISKSELVNRALRAHYEKMPERERQSMIERSKNTY